jgi:hypothetical protein
MTKFMSIDKAAKALVQLSDAEWMQVKCDEEQWRELRNRKIDPEPARD